MTRVTLCDKLLKLLALLKPIRTAHHMFVEPCQNGGETCDVLVGNLSPGRRFLW